MKSKKYLSFLGDDSDTNLHSNKEKPSTPDENNYEKFKKDDTREIVEFTHISSEMLKMMKEHDNLNQCHGELYCSHKARYGLKTLFYYSCTECNYKYKFYSEGLKTSKKMGINKEAVISSLNIGIGCTQQDAYLAGIKVNSMSSKTYKKNIDWSYHVLKELAEKCMKDAGVEERTLAENDQQFHEGTPYIYVVTDGSWEIRSYGTNFNSPCGLGVIIGSRTGKVLHVGIKNNYCRTHAMAESRNLPEDQVPKHTCYKNWNEKIPSCLMESEAILEGFQESVKKHGLLYKFVVTDGDSNVYKSLTENRVYEFYHLIPTRIRCYNHLIRNLFGKLREISKNSKQPDGTGQIKNFSFLKQLIEDKSKLIRKLINKSVDYWRKEDLDFKDQEEGLRKDINSIINHVFGEHESCNQVKGFRCELDQTSDTIEHSKNYVPDMKATGLYQKIVKAMDTVSFHSDSLLYKMTNNIAESFNALVAVNIGGKRVNFSLTNQYFVRIYAATIRQNTQQFLSEVHNHVYKEVPKIIKEFDQNRKDTQKKQRENRQKNGRKRKYKKKKIKGVNYHGPRADELDKTPEQIETDIKKHFALLEKNQKNRRGLEEETRGNENSEKRACIQKNYLTPPHFGPIIVMQQGTSCSANVEKMLYCSNEKTPQSLYVNQHERSVIQDFEKDFDVKIVKTGLIVNESTFYLACTPHGVTRLNDEIYLVKFILREEAHEFDIKDAVEIVKEWRSNFTLKQTATEPEVSLKKGCHLYYEIQGELHITQKQFCMCTLWTSKSRVHLRVQRNDPFWIDKMESKLERFYNHCLLPEIINPQLSKGCAINDPDYIKEAKEKKKEKAANKKRKVSGDPELIEKKTKKRKMKNFDEENPVFPSSLKIRESGRVLAEQTPEEKKELKEWVEESHPNLIDYGHVKDIILSDDWLDDDCLDAFIMVVKLKAKEVSIQSVMYMEFPELVEPVLSGKSIALIGGNCIGHWRVAYFENNKLKIYDSKISVMNHSYSSDEVEYLQKRFPNAQIPEMVEEMAVQQSDGNTCGVYSAAISIDIIQGRNPSLQHYSESVKEVRNHFWHQVIQPQQLVQFPCNKKRLTRSIRSRKK